MTFLEKLDAKMKELGLNKSTLSQLSGVPYTTIDGFYKKGYENAKISTVRKIAAALGVSLDYLVEDQKKEKPITGEGDGLKDEVIARLMLLTPEELAKVDAFVQGLLASR